MLNKKITIKVNFQKLLEDSENWEQTKVNSLLDLSTKDCEWTNSTGSIWKAINTEDDSIILELK